VLVSDIAAVSGPPASHVWSEDADHSAERIWSVLSSL
jgi:hypothetical protein